MDPTICSILRPLRSWASSPSLSPRASGRGGAAAQGSRSTCSISSLRRNDPWRSCPLRRNDRQRYDTPRLRLFSPPTRPFPFFEQNRQATPYGHSRHSTQAPYFRDPISPAPPELAGRPGHFTSPTSSIYKSSSSTPSFYSSLLHEHEHKGRGPHGLHDAASCSLSPTDAPYPPSDPLDLDPRTALGQHGPVLPFRSCSSCGSFSFQI